MKQYFWSMFGLVVLAVTAATTATAAPCPGGSTLEVEACWKSKLDQGKEDLNRYVAAVINRIEKENTPQTLKAFKAGQDAWVIYRDHECSAVYTAWEPGTIRGSMALVCMQRLTEDRTHEIWRDWLTYMDNTPPILPEPVTHTGSL